MRSGWLTAGVLCFIGTGLVACGSDSDETSSLQPTAEQIVAAKQIQRLGDQATDAISKTDAAALCALVEPTGLKREFGNAKRCEMRLDGELRQSGNSPRIEFTEISVSGDTATATSTSENDGSSDYFFVRVGGKWYLDISGESDAPAESGE